MGFFDRLSTGWRLGKQSLSIVWKDKTLAVFPLLSAIATIIAMAGFYFGIGPEEFERVMAATEGGESLDDVSPLSYALALGAYFTAAFITIFFNVALVGCAHISIEHRDSKLKDGFAVAMAHLPSILIWALVSGSVGLLISAIERNGRAGQIVRSLLGAAWAVITYFVIPVMVLERTSVITAIGRSTKIMAASWGENIGARFGLGWIFFLLNLPTIALVFLGFIGGPALAVILIPIAVIYGICTTVLSQAAKSVLTVVLYKFATDKTVADGFDPNDIQNSFGLR